jgi:hypothetical protein
MLSMNVRIGHHHSRITGQEEAVHNAPMNISDYREVWSGELPVSTFGEIEMLLRVNNPNRPEGAPPILPGDIVILAADDRRVYRAHASGHVDFPLSPWQRLW